MCGLAGIISWDPRYPITRDLLERMSTRIAHRGPDGHGIYLSHENAISPDTPQVGLAHRRLAIIDPDPRANQPFTDHHDRWLVFNGEIYNYRQLRKELESLLPDYAWRTQSDTEVLLAAYTAWGRRCVDHLNGMYALAVWDGRENRLFLARDRMGQKPLYLAYLQRSGGWASNINPQHDLDTPLAVAFASELGALRALPWFESALDVAALRNYLAWGYSLSPETIYRGARTLPPGNWMVITDAGGAGGRHEFDPDPRDDAISDEQARSETRQLVLRAVQRQMVADVPIGCFLSGGMDSSIVAAAMKQSAGDQRVMTFSIGFDDPRYDETPYAREVAQHMGTEHHEFTVKPDAATDLPKLAEVFGEPFGDSSALPTHYLARETRGHVKVALSGDGGDELFCGYDRYRAMNLGRKLRSLLGKPGVSTLAGLRHLLPGIHPKGRLARLKRFLASLSLSDERRYMAYLRLFDDETIRRLLRDASSLASEPDSAVEVVLSVLLQFGPVRAAMALDRVMYLPCDLLTKVDRASMLHALEVRSPFMDHELVEFAASLNTVQLLKGGSKRMLREAFADLLPAHVFTRKKMGFAVPIGEWFRDSLRPMLRDHLFAADSFARSHFNLDALEQILSDHESRRADHAQRLYALLMLELWHKQQP